MYRIIPVLLCPWLQNLTKDPGCRGSFEGYAASWWLQVSQPCNFKHGSVFPPVKWRRWPLPGLQEAGLEVWAGRLLRAHGKWKLRNISIAF